VLWKWIGACSNLTARICRDLCLMLEEFAGATRSFKRRRVISWRKIWMIARISHSICRGRSLPQSVFPSDNPLEWG
jgi:hypothetical protein